MSQPSTIKPMPFWLSSLFFGIPSAIGWLGVYVGLPALARAGVPLFWNSLLCIVGPLALMLAAAFVAYRLEGHPLSWAGVRARFRLKPLRGEEWFWTLGLCLVCPATYFLLLPTARWLASIPLFAPPEFLPSLVRPDVSQVLPTEYLGVPLRGNWWLLLVHIGVLCLNIYGEELWWRGYILPRQELVHGRWTWLIHGVQWTLFHSFWKWNLIAILPGAVALSFVTSRLKNTTPGIVAHWAENALGLVAILLGVTG